MSANGMHGGSCYLGSMLPGVGMHAPSLKFLNDLYAIIPCVGCLMERNWAKFRKERKVVSEKVDGERTKFLIPGFPKQWLN